MWKAQKLRFLWLRNETGMRVIRENKFIALVSFFGSSTDAKFCKITLLKYAKKKETSLQLL